MTDHKKTDDFTVRVPSASSRDAEKEAFLRPDSVAVVPGELSALWSKIENSPGAAIAAYCLASMSMTLVNKFVVSGSGWNLNFFYLAIQSTVGIVAVMACNRMGVITDLSAFEWKKAKSWFPISLVFVGMLYTSTQALQFLSVPVYTIFKNLTIIVIAYGESLWFGGRVSSLALLSFGLMVLSSVVAAWSDIQHAISHDGGAATSDMSTLNAGYFWMGLNIFCAAAYPLCQRKATKKAGFKNWDLMFYNNLLSLPILIICSGLVEDWSEANLQKNFPVATRNHLLIGMVYSGLVGILMSYCTPWCIRATSSTTYAMVGALNKLPVSIAGILFFAAPITFGGTIAIFIGFFSGLVYTWAKIRGSTKPAAVLPTTELKR